MHLATRPRCTSVPDCIRGTTPGTIRGMIPGITATIVHGAGTAIVTAITIRGGITATIPVPGMAEATYTIITARAAEARGTADRRIIVQGIWEAAISAAIVATRVPMEVMAVVREAARMVAAVPVAVRSEAIAVQAVRAPAVVHLAAAVLVARQEAECALPPVAVRLEADVKRVRLVQENNVLI